MERYCGRGINLTLTIFLMKIPTHPGIETAFGPIWKDV